MPIHASRKKYRGLSEDTKTGIFSKSEPDKLFIDCKYVQLPDFIVFVLFNNYFSQLWYPAIGISIIRLHDTTVKAQVDLQVFSECSIVNKRPRGLNADGYSKCWLVCKE